MECQELCSRLDEELATDAYAEVDASANGLQVGSGEREIEHVAVAVDAALETFRRAGDAGADLLVAHHGMFWGSIDRLVGRQYDRVATLIENDLCLYVSHLPLDGHVTLGNAAAVADILDLQERTTFGDHRGESVGLRGNLSEPLSIDSLAGQLRPHLHSSGHEMKLLTFGPDLVLDVAIVTGSGVDFLEEAVEAGADVLITGEGKQQVYHDAQEHGIHVLLGGHYATETFGVRAVADLVEGWGVETTFIDCPTGL